MCIRDSYISLDDHISDRQLQCWLTRTTRSDLSPEHIHLNHSLASSPGIRLSPLQRGCSAAANVLPQTQNIVQQEVQNYSMQDSSMVWGTAAPLVGCLPAARQKACRFARNRKSFPLQRAMLSRTANHQLLCFLIFYLVHSPDASFHTRTLKLQNLTTPKTVGQ